jgi:uncharacterized damage-inducible protein DinB
MASLRDAVVQELRARLKAAHERIENCLEQLSDEQVWWRPRPEMNSIANLVLHLCGNMRQWIIHGATGAADDRNRPQEFSDRSMAPKRQLQERLREVAGQADEVIAGLSEDQLVQPRRIQGFDETVVSAVIHSVAHFAGHAQEIIHMTRERLGEGYRMFWKPASVEQGAGR